MIKMICNSCKKEIDFTCLTECIHELAKCGWNNGDLFFKSEPEGDICEECAIKLNKILKEAKTKFLKGEK